MDVLRVDPVLVQVALVVVIATALTYGVARFALRPKPRPEVKPQLLAVTMQALGWTDTRPSLPVHPLSWRVELRPSPVTGLGLPVAIAPDGREHRYCTRVVGFVGDATVAEVSQAADALADAQRKGKLRLQDQERAGLWPESVMSKAINHQQAIQKLTEVERRNTRPINRDTPPADGWVVRKVGLTHVAMDPNSDRSSYWDESRQAWCALEPGSFLDRSARTRLDPHYEASRKAQERLAKIVKDFETQQIESITDWRDPLFQPPADGVFKFYTCG